MQKRNKTIIRPWGQYTILKKRQGYWIKKLFVRKGERLSLQSHKDRHEIWIVLSGKIAVLKGKQHLKLKTGELLKIGRNEKHRITGLRGSWILEVALGKVRERDIIRFQDDYGRIK